MRIQLSDHFTYKRLLRFTIPSIIMMICTSVYSIVDGLFVSNYVGTTPFAALNLMMPLLMGISTVGFMIGTGGSAVVAIKLGEGEREKANEYFSMLIYILIGAGIVAAVTAIIFMRPIAYAIGATDDMIEYCVLYGRILCVSLTGFMLQIFLDALGRSKSSKFIKNILGSALVTLLALLVMLLKLPVHYDKVIIGSIMPLVPGIALTTSIRDLFNGDYLSGAIHMIDAVLTAFCIAVGVGTVITVFRTLMGGGLFA